MWQTRIGSSRGTVSLVALCFVAVLGISLASYIAICSRAMTLSNRSFQASLGKQLAEAGIEEALRAFNKNDWSDWTNSGYSADWTLDTTNKRATATLTIPTSSFGQGTTATIRIRVDNYDAAHLGSTWSSTKTYRIGDLIGYNGVWYRSVQNDNLNKTPGLSLAWWVPAPIAWTWSSNVSYSRYDVVNYLGSWYRCHTSHTSSSSILPSSTSYWAPLPEVSLNWSSGTSYSRGTTMYYSGAWYHCITTHTSSSTITPTNTTYWAPVLTSSGAIDYPVATTYAVGVAYNIGDYVFRDSSNTWYRCVASQPYTYSGGDYSDSSKWVSSIPYISWAYRSATSYAFDDIVYYSDTWYRCIASSSSGNLPTNTTYWEKALSGNVQGWSSGNNYNPGDAVYHNGTSQWYRCILAHASSSTLTPTSTTYWTNTPLLSTAWDSGKQYSLNDTVRYKGVWYISIHSGTGNVARNPTTGTTYWVGANTTNTSYTWNTTTAYSVGNYRCYGGVWYRCTASNTNKSPNDTSYWTAVTAPVVYAEATVTITNSPSLKTQLRAPIAPSPLFPNAVGATTDLTITTGTGAVDSYDSDVGAYGGSNIAHTAVLAAGTTLAINGTTAVKGYLAWPFGSAPSGISTGTTVQGPTSPVSPNVDKTRLSRSPSVPQFATIPSGDLSTAWASTPKGTSLGGSSVVNLGIPGATAPSRYYYSGTWLQLGSSESIQTININGPVILYINGSLRMRGGSTININGNGSAEIHVGKQLLFESGTSGIVNKSPDSSAPDPKKLILIVHSATSDAQVYRYVSSLHGVLYAPYTTTSTGLVIDNGMSVYGAISASKVTFDDQANIHYDTSLRYATFGGVDQPYAVSEWRELPLTEQATMP